MIGHVLKQEIDEYAERLRNSNALLQMAKSGLIQRRTALTFLWNIRYVLREAPYQLQLARQVASERGQTELAAFYREKISEECGHDRWAEDDLLTLDPEVDIANSAAPLGPLTELTAFLKTATEQEPAQFLVYLLFAEYFTVKLGPEWVTLLETQCAIPASAMTSIARHAELDKDHVEADVEIIERLLPASAGVSELQATLRYSMDCWERFYDELAKLPN
jgi:hypothetical protein